MIEIRNVSFHIGARPILNDVSLNIPEGGITALIGPNGAGKSTLLSFMARLRPLESGSIAYGGRNLADMHTAEAAKVLSILTQENSIHSRISVRDLLLFGRYPYHQGRPAAADFAIVEEAIGQFHLQDLSDRYLTELSGGQRSVRKALFKSGVPISSATCWRVMPGRSASTEAASSGTPCTTDSL